ncbi:hypothetical protein [Occallatibacter riparius]|uniref:Uncharacterized protein n=1 Tax=Occallatibacter riparius TaxID=1002689 RepID=A0A9J7BR34_9BACT|nr:hypothetical protein [Occallatibacter riparius]UWZ83541.1 hypothetical protein MOP44_23610 [Occallatibacter riparius]
MQKTLISCALAMATVPTVLAQGFHPNSLVVSRSVYTGDASTVTVGQTLPPNCVPGKVTLPKIGGGTTSVTVTCATATADGSYPTVFNNDGPDGAFGVTSPIFLDNISTEGKLFNTLAIPSDQIVTSFSSKSELSLNLSDDGKSITFVGYRGATGFLTAPNQLDVSNSNTPGVIDPTNPVNSQYYRSVAEVDANGHIQYTNGNAYSGNNGRAAFKANGTYYLTGNNNNGGLSKSQLPTTQVGRNLVRSTGAELLIPGQTPPVPPSIAMIGDFETTQVGYSTPDKPGKDNNFRGLTIFNNTMYVTKGSGGNGINTVYQVGNAGTLPSGTPAELAALPITILPGFPTSLASGVDQNGNPAPVMFPFGIFFANANTLYVCDEGDGVAADAATGSGGIQKWTKTDGIWHLLYTLQAGLDLGVPYAVSNYPSPATAGCRNLTGKVNGQGTVELYAVTSTVSASGDQGADPNKLVKVIDLLKATTLPTEGGLGQFTVIRTAASGEVLRGVAFAPRK